MLSLLRLFTVALQAVSFYREGGIAVVAGSACAAGFHHLHCEALGAAIGENLGVAIAALVYFGMKRMAEGPHNGAGGVFKRQFARFHTFVTFITITGRCKRILAVMADTAGFAFGHVVHGGLSDDGFKGKCFCMAIFAAVNPGMECMAESCRCHTFYVECDLFWFECLVAAIAICCHSKRAFPVVAGTAGASFFHLRHRYRFLTAGNDFTVMACFAGAACFGNVERVAECNGAQAFNCIGDISRLAGVATGTVLVAGNTESLNAAVACAAGFGFFHFSHGIALLASQVEDRIVAYSTIVIVFFQVQFVAEHDWIGVFEIEFDVLGFNRTCAYGRQYNH